MSKYKHFLFLVLFLFGFQAFAGSFQPCSETARGDIPVDSQTDVNRMIMDCHETEEDKTIFPEICDAQHCCIGATFSIAYPYGHSVVDMNKARISSLNHAYIYSSPNDIYHPPKLLL